MFTRGYLSWALSHPISPTTLTPAGALLHQAWITAFDVENVAGRLEYPVVHESNCSRFHVSLFVPNNNHHDDHMDYR